jgi:hypothetical protein
VLYQTCEWQRQERKVSTPTPTPTPTPTCILNNLQPQQSNMFATLAIKASVSDEEKQFCSPPLATNMTLIVHNMQCFLWPPQEDFESFLRLLGFHPLLNLGVVT